MRILTYNIQEWQGVDGRVDWHRTARVIAQSGASVVALQEVVDPVDDLSPIADVAATTGMHVAQHGRHAILSHFPIDSQHPCMMPKHGGGAGARCLEARLRLDDGQPLVVYAVHFWWSSEATRLSQIDAVMKHIEGKGDHTHILLGDFNAIAPGERALPHLYLDDAGAGRPPFPSTDRALVEKLPDQYAFVSDATGHSENASHDVIRLVESRGYVDAYRAVGRGNPGTWGPAISESSAIRLDYVFVSPALRAQLKSCRRLDAGLASVASDHYPVLVKLNL